MAPLIQLSFAGNRRLVYLTPATAGIVYRQFARVNDGYIRRLIISGKNKDRILHDLWNLSHWTTLSWQDAKKIEDELNVRVIDNNLQLVENEGQLFDGNTNSIDICKNSNPKSYIFRYGAVFTVESLAKSRMLGQKNIDLFWQDRELNFHYVRYYGLQSSLRDKQLKLLFRFPLDLSKPQIFTLSEFQPRQILKIRSIRPCKGFKLSNLAKLDL
jgi:hypothetical protein